MQVLYFVQKCFYKYLYSLQAYSYLALYHPPMEKLFYIRILKIKRRMLVCLTALFSSFCWGKSLSRHKDMKDVDSLIIYVKEGTKTFNLDSIYVTRDSNLQHAEKPIIYLSAGTIVSGNLNAKQVYIGKSNNSKRKNNNRISHAKKNIKNNEGSVKTIKKKIPYTYRSSSNNNVITSFICKQSMIVPIVKDYKHNILNNGRIQGLLSFFNNKRKRDYEKEKRNILCIYDKRTQRGPPLLI